MAFLIPQKDLRKPKKLPNENILPFITTFNPNNPNIYSTIKSSVNCLKNNNVSGFHNIKLIQSKRKSPNLKKVLTKAEFGEILSSTFNCSDKRCECCNYLLMITTPLNRFTCDSFNLIYVVICGTCKEEYIGETREGKTKLRDRVRVYHQHIRQPQYQQLKVEGHLRVCGNKEFWYFLCYQCVHKVHIQDEAMKRGSSKSSKQNQINYDEKLTLEKFARNLPL